MRALNEMKENGLWNGSFNGRESTLQQLSPYVGKSKTGLIHVLLELFTRPGQWVCDPFSGSGVVPLEALLMGRRTIANDLSTYAYCLTRGKLEAPTTYEEAARRTDWMLTYVRRHWTDFDLRRVDQWVRGFFQPKTLKETLAAFEYCHKRHQWFLAACLCGILHHQRPGFLSYPASHMVPYLRTKLFPRDEYPEMYAYRPLAERISAKTRRAYRRPLVGQMWSRQDYQIYKRDARSLAIADASVDFILTSPPYYGALDYARDNRLRLWFLGERDWKRLDHRLMARLGTYETEMAACLQEMHRVLKRGKYCVLVVGEVQSNGRTRDTGAVLSALAFGVTRGGLSLNCAIEDNLPDIRRSRRGTKTTQVEKVLVLQKNY